MGIQLRVMVYYGYFMLTKASAAFFSAGTGFISIRPRPNVSNLQQQKMNLIDSLENLMIGSIFPEDEVKIEDPHKELSSFTDLAFGTLDDITIAHNSLTAFLLEWGKTLEKAEGSEKLSTPVFCVPFTPKKLKKDLDFLPSQLTGGSEEVIKTSRVKISFCKTKRYLSSSEQRGLEKGQIPDRKGAKIDSWSPGGILLLVQTVDCGRSNVDDSSGGVHKDFMLRLIAKRCDIDGDTVVKISSERTIVRRLKDAIRIWKKMRTL